jgi:anti-sigma regulatory factor (Ser/Thr protein kinase)
MTFVDVSFSYTRPARTLAAYHAVYADELTRHPFVRAVADVQFGPEPREWDLWTGYEAVFNRAFASVPAWVLCTYAGEHLPDPVREGVWRTHAEVLTEDGWRASHRFDDPDRVLRAATSPPEPLPDLHPIPLEGGIDLVRERLARAMEAEHVPRRKVVDLLLAVTEVVANADQHGGGVAVVRVGSCGGRFVCEVVDRGHGFDDPGVGYVPPGDGDGAGLWIARQLIWQVDFFRGPDGFTARMRF